MICSLILPNMRIRGSGLYKVKTQHHASKLTFDENSLQPKNPGVLQPFAKKHQNAPTFVGAPRSPSGPFIPPSRNSCAAGSAAFIRGFRSGDSRFPKTSSFCTAVGQDNLLVSWGPLTAIYRSRVYRLRSSGGFGN